MNIDYELIDSGEGRRLERFGDYILDRPDPEVLWKKTLPASEWQKANARFDKKWINRSKVSEKWQISVGELNFWLKLTPFKHTGIFPEQVFEWDYLNKQISKAWPNQNLVNKYANNPINKGKLLNVLNLFAYTGVATMFAAKAGARVTHVDASKPAITWANENRELNNLESAPIRWIVDDVPTFVEKEIRRKNFYDAIIMDPPVYGHGPTGKAWSFAKDFPKLIADCLRLLSDTPLFVLVNAYAVSTSPITLANTLNGQIIGLGGKVDFGELTLKEKSGNRILSTGIWGLWSKN